MGGVMQSPLLFERSWQPNPGFSFLGMIRPQIQERFTGENKIFVDVAILATPALAQSGRR